MRVIIVDTRRMKWKRMEMENNQVKEKNIYIYIYTSILEEVQGAKDRASPF